MNLQPPRRSLLLALAGLGAGSILSDSCALSQNTAGKGFALQDSEGEHLIHFRDGGKICIKTGLASGSPHLTIGTQQVLKGSGIPTHRHTKMDEAFLILDGSGVFHLEGSSFPVANGAFLYIPQNAWHGFENPDHELQLMWIMTPAGLDGFFRETCSPPGTTPRRLNRSQIRDIAWKYNTEFV